MMQNERFEVCRILKTDADTVQIPFILSPAATMHK
jgi:hypothetical protein